MKSKLRITLVGLASSFSLIMGMAANAGHFHHRHHHGHHHGLYFGGGGFHHGGIGISFGGPRYSWGHPGYINRYDHWDRWNRYDRWDRYGYGGYGGYGYGYGYPAYGYRHYRHHRHYHHNDAAAIMFGTMLGVMAYENNRPVYRCRGIVRGQWREGRAYRNGPCYVPVRGLRAPVYRYRGF